jgi:hypothetical protein
MLFIFFSLLISLDVRKQFKHDLTTVRSNQPQFFHAFMIGIYALDLEILAGIFRPD